MTRFFEDYMIGDRVELGSHHFTREAIIAFGQTYDPQPFHVDEAAGRASLFGGLAASGWHICGVWMRLMVDFRARDAAELAARGVPLAKLGPSPGVKSLKWPNPVLAGDTVRYSTTVTGLIDLKSRPNWGLWLSLNEAVNQNGLPVLSFIGQVLAERRVPFVPPSGPEK